MSQSEDERIQNEKIDRAMQQIEKQVRQNMATLRRWAKEAKLPREARTPAGKRLQATRRMMLRMKASDYEGILDRPRDEIAAMLREVMGDAMFAEQGEFNRALKAAMDTVVERIHQEQAEDVNV